MRKDVYPCKHQLHYEKWGVKGYKPHGHVFLMKRNNISLDECLRTHKAFTGDKMQNKVFCLNYRHFFINSGYPCDKF